MSNDILDLLERWITLLSISGKGTKETVRLEMIEVRDSLNSTKEEENE